MSTVTIRLWQSRASSDIVTLLVDGVPVSGQVELEAKQDTIEKPYSMYDPAPDVREYIAGMTTYTLWLNGSAIMTTYNYPDERNADARGYIEYVWRNVEVTLP